MATEPHVGESFQSWKEAEDRLNAFAKSKYFVWSVDSSNSIAAENKKLASRGVPQSEWYDVSLKHKNVKLVCVFGGKKRIGSGAGARPMQSTIKSDCTVFIHMIAQKKSINIVKAVLGPHNHECSENIYASLSKVRAKALGEESVASTAELLFKGGVKPSKMRPLLRAMGAGQITQRDLQNFRQKMKKAALGGLTPEEKLVEVLEKLLESDKAATIHIQQSPEKDLIFLFLQTGAMKEVMVKYGRVLLLDHTYKLNKNKMPLTVLMTMDGDLDGRPVGYAFVANEQLVTVKAVMEVFKTAIGPEAAAQVTSITIDKDYTEISAVTAVFPDAVVQLCDFHVSRTFNGKTHQEDPRVKEILTSMRYCTEDADFKNLENELKDVATEKFFCYFEKNWLQCPIAWSYRDRKVVANSGNATNNRLETHNAKIKLVVNSCSELYEAVEGIIQVHMNKEEDVIFRKTSAAIKQAYMTKCKDPIANTILQDLTKNAAKIVIWELEAEPAQSQMIKFKSTETSCQCIHACSYRGQLPCRHMFACRRISGNKLYVKGEIDKMYWKESIDECGALICNTIAGPQVGSHVVPSKLVPKSQSEKYSYSMSLSKQICSSLAECGDVQFMERYAQLKELFKLWCAGTTVRIIDAANFSEIEIGVPQETTVPTNDAGLNKTEVSSNKKDTDIAVDDEESVSTHDSNETEPSADKHSEDIAVDAEESVSTHDSNETEPSANKNSKDVTTCVACKNNDFPSGAHKCSFCNTNVHILLGCSIPLPGAQEGHGERRICTSCSKKGKSGHENVTHMSVGDVQSRSPASEQYHAFSPVPSADTIPKCFCGVEANRILTSPYCKRPNRPMYKCSLFKCRFSRFAKGGGNSSSVNSLSSPSPIKDMPITSVPKDQILSDPSNNSSFLFEEDAEENLQTLVKLIEEYEMQEKAKQKENEVEEIILSSDDEQIFGSKTANAVKEEILISDFGDTLISDEEIEFENRNESDPSLKVNKNVQSHATSGDVSPAANLLRKAMDGIKLPKVKPRGRPRGAGKTVLSVYKQNKTKASQGKTATHRGRKPKGAIGTNAPADREARGLQIPNEAVIPEAGNQCWHLKSQTSENELYEIKVIERQQKCFCGSQICVHCLICSCPDYTHRKVPCKHMYKIVVFVREEGFQSGVAVDAGKDDRIATHSPTSRPGYSDGKRALFSSINAGGKSPKRPKYSNPMSCIVCELIAVGNGTACSQCKGVVHVDECSIMYDAERICKKCSYTLDIVALPWKTASGQFQDISGSYMCQGISLSKYDFDSLRDSCLLTDTIIDAFASLMDDVLQEKWAEAYIMSAQALENLTFGVDSYLTSVANSPIIYNDIWLVPAHINRNHWILLVVIVKKKIILILDSLNNTGTAGGSVIECVQMLQLFIDRSINHCTGQNADWEKWQVFYPSDLPQQGNGYDCGMHVCLWMYSISHEVALPGNISSQVQPARRWLSNFILTESELVVRRTPQQHNTNEAIQRFYAEVDENISNGTHVVLKPWLDYPKISISPKAPENIPTLDYLAGLVKGLFQATEKRCGAPNGCSHSGEGIMILCTLCREYYHQRCVNDLRPAPGAHDPYLCPQHRLDEEKPKRQVKKPVRFRISVS